MTVFPLASRPGAQDGTTTRGNREPGEPKTGAYLQPGRIFVGRGEEAVKTVLGSCVAVCLWDAERAIGGMNHYLLPLRARGSRSSARFGEVAIQQLLEELERRGARRNGLRARVYGGACVVDSLRRSGGGVGPRNIEVAERLLDHLGIPIVARDVGGRAGRRVVFRVGDGEVWMRHLQRGRR
ncbi:MAG: chemotaxis protein CheD [Deltaproteobacteria bacterium]|nr:chemotaxis protein CheD [Deltaproteobacteria bacterium]